eukprot:6052780-Lingulodinium_polyedra.AAC.1
MCIRDSAWRAPRIAAVGKIGELCHGPCRVPRQAAPLRAAQPGPRPRAKPPHWPSGRPPPFPS